MLRDLFSQVYPCVSEEVGIHVVPKGAVVFSKASPGVFPPFLMQNINKPGREILKLCDGTRTIEEVIELSRVANADDQKAIVASVAFLEESRKSGHIAYADKAVPKHFRVTGSDTHTFPIHMAIEVTDGCNLRCKHCYRESSPEKTQLLTISELTCILSDLAKIGVRVVELTGGEPTIHPHFYDLITFCNEVFLMVAILTNGMLIDKTATQRLARFKDKLIVSVSLDSPTKDFHDSFRGVSGSFERARDAIRYLSDEGIFVRVAMDVTANNRNLIEETLILAKELGARSFGYNHVLPLGRGKTCSRMSIQEMKSQIALEKRIIDQYAGFVAVITEEAMAEMKKVGNCGAGHRTHVVGPTGNARPCLMMPEEYLTIGNLLQQSAEEIFSKPIVEFMRKLKAPDEDSCRGCQKPLFCRHCFIRAIYANEELDEPCAWAKKNKVLDVFRLNEYSKKTVTTNMGIRATAAGSCPRG